MREWEAWDARTSGANFERSREVTRAVQFLLNGPTARRALVGLTDCSMPQRRVSGFSLPTHYPDRGFMVDLEVQEELLGVLPALLHKERWFATRERAEACAEFFVWALDGCTDGQLDALAREHAGRMT